MNRAEPDEVSRQIDLLATPVGQPRSGATRYAAAMFLFHEGRLTADVLEIYRRCCKFDDEDPVDLARFEGLDPRLQTHPETMSQK